MSILDDAIREHLELKRAHGADDVELKKLEDEAFGPAVRPEEPDPFAEAPTEFLVAPSEGPGETTDEEPQERRAPSIADLQEAPDFPTAEPADEEQTALEHEAIPASDAPAEPDSQADIDGGHSTEERHAIAEQPTELFDVEGQFEDAATEADAPSDEQLVDAEMAEPRLAPVDPLAGIEASAPGKPADAPLAEDEPADEFDEFFSEQRLSDELNQALEAPLPDEPGAPATEEATAIYQVEADDSEDDSDEELSDEHDVVDEHSDEYEVPDGRTEERPALADEAASDEHELPEAASDEHDLLEEDEDDSEEHELPGEATDEHGLPVETEEHALPPAAAADAPPAPAASSHEDVLEDTPDFLEDAPEDDNLWFEQKPPKDFDFDD